MTHLALSLLGTFQVTLDGALVTTFEYDKVRALLAYLAVESDRPHRRETLVGLLWPERSEESARRNLSQALFKLRHAIHDRKAAPPFLLIDHWALQFNLTSDHYLDVTKFADLLDACDRHCHRRRDVCGICVERLGQAVALYRGSFLAGFSLGDSPAYEEWMVLNRERLNRLVMEALHRLATYHHAREDYEAGLQYARQQVTLDPWREGAHRQLMQLLALSGQRAAALAQFETCRCILANDLGIKPALETARLYEKIRKGDLEACLLSPVEKPKPAPYLPAFLAKDEGMDVERPIFVARDGELARLNELLDTALAGKGQVIFIAGEAGSGKTALAGEFAQRAQDKHAGLVVAAAKCNAYTGVGDPYHPFRQALGLLTGDIEGGWAAGAISTEQARRLWHTLPVTAQVLMEEGADLIDIFVPGKALVQRARAWATLEADWLTRLDGMAEQKAQLTTAAKLQQRDLFEQYTRVLQALARQAPLVLVLDDLQWADSGSVNLLFHLCRGLGASRILIVGAYRPEDIALGLGGLPALYTVTPPRKRQRHPLHLLLKEFQRDFGDIVVDLDKANGREFAEAFLDSQPNQMGTTFRETLYRQTRGHPLFTIELLRGMQERAEVVQDEAGCWVEGAILDWDTLPARVEAAIGQRIDRLPEELRRTLTAASVEGETFTAEVVSRVQACAEQEVVQRLSGELDRQHRLVIAQGVRRIGNQRLSLYRFRHILFQRFLYNSLDDVERTHLHEKVGAELETLYGEGTEETAAMAGRLAWHFQEAGALQKTVGYLRQAGNRAIQMSANEEAIAHLSKGLEILSSLPLTPEHAEQELRLQMSLGTAFGMDRGHAAPEVEKAYSRALELCRVVADAPESFSAVWGLWRFYMVRAKLDKAHELAEQCLRLAQRTEDPGFLLEAHQALGVTFYFRGELLLAQEHLEQSMRLYDPQQHQDHAFLFGQDPWVACAGIAVLALSYLGYPDQAMRTYRNALALAQEISHPLSLAFALSTGAALHRHLGAGQPAQECAEAAIALSTKHGFAQWLALATSLRGWALAEQGHVAEGIQQIRQGLDAYRATGGEVARTRYLAKLADAYGKMQQTDKGLAVVAEALEAAHRTGEHLEEAQLYRLKGELLSAESTKSKQGEAEDCIRHAINVARHQSAKSLELRAVMSLSRLLQKQGKQEKARRMLAEIYDWFTEGFETPDLIKARALLGELADD